MRRLSIASGVLVVAATAVVCFVIPASCVISVGNDVSAVRSLEIYGYAKAHLSLITRVAGFNTRMTPVAFCLGDDWILVVWHDDQVRRMVHFQYVSRGEHQYGDWIHTREVESFEVPRPGILFYFVGLTALFGIGWATCRSRRIYRVVLGFLLFLAVLGNAVVGCIAESVPIFPICVSVGWVAAFLLGANAFRRDQNNDPTGTLKPGSTSSPLSTSEEPRMAI
jgi:hypothetical protein